MPIPASPRPIVDTATLFGRCLAMIRADLGLTQGEMAALLRVSRPTITHFETGRATPSFHVLLRLGQRVAVGLERARRQVQQGEDGGGIAVHARVGDALPETQEDVE